MTAHKLSQRSLAMAGRCPSFSSSCPLFSSRCPPSTSSSIKTISSSRITTSSTDVRFEIVFSQTVCQARSFHSVNHTNRHRLDGKYRLVDVKNRLEEVKYRPLEKCKYRPLEKCKYRLVDGKCESVRIQRRHFGGEVRNYYEVLGIPRDASSKDIKQAYHKKVKELHPDTGEKPSTIEFNKVLEVYKLLNNKNEKRMYDEWLLRPQSRTQEYRDKEYRGNDSTGTYTPEEDHSQQGFSSTDGSQYNRGRATNRYAHHDHYNRNYVFGGGPPSWQRTLSYATPLLFLLLMLQISAGERHRTTSNLTDIQIQQEKGIYEYCYGVGNQSFLVVWTKRAMYARENEERPDNPLRYLNSVYYKIGSGQTTSIEAQNQSDRLSDRLQAGKTSDAGSIADISDDWDGDAQMKTKKLSKEEDQPVTPPILQPSAAQGDTGDHTGNRDTGNGDHQFVNTAPEFVRAWFNPVSRRFERLQDEGHFPPAVTSLFRYYQQNQIDVMKLVENSYTRDMQIHPALVLRFLDMHSNMKPLRIELVDQRFTVMPETVFYDKNSKRQMTATEWMIQANAYNGNGSNQKNYDEQRSCYQMPAQSIYGSKSGFRS